MSLSFNVVGVYYIFPTTNVPPQVLGMFSTHPASHPQRLESFLIETVLKNGCAAKMVIIWWYSHIISHILWEYISFYIYIYIYLLPFPHENNPWKRLLLRHTHNYSTACWKFTTELIDSSSDCPSAAMAWRITSTIQICGSTWRMDQMDGARQASEFPVDQETGCISWW